MYMREAGPPLTLDEARAAHAGGKFTAGSSAILTFGIGSKPVWIRLPVSNPTGARQSRRLLIENSWLDHLDVYFVKDDRFVGSYNAGDSRQFKDRPVPGRFFAFNHDFDAGTTDIYLRIATPDPIVVPIFLLSAEDAHKRENIQEYSYGFVYGYLAALLAYNLLLFLSLRNARYLRYAVFMAMFILANIAYTGHGFAWLWPEQVAWQRWIIPILMVLFATSGLAFAKHFLDTRTRFPRAHKVVTGINGLFIAFLAMAVLFSDSQVYALWAAFLFVTIFSVTMLVLGLMSYFSGYVFSRYFLLASISSMLGTAVTALSVWGFIAFSDWTFRAVEIGMLVDAALLALALADQFRSIQAGRLLAERRAARDPLTDLYNRRSFLEMAQPIWSTAHRNNRSLSMIMLDIDNFKAINDLHGHAMGDASLVATGKLLANAVRDGDIVARWGGEEFLLLLPETKLDAAIALAERLQNTIPECRLPSRNGEITFTASFGVAHKTDQESLDSLIREADNFLYQSKKNGRNRISSELGCLKSLTK